MPLPARTREDALTDVNPRTRKRTVGLLALQGDFAMHRQAIESLGHTCEEIRSAEELERVDCLIMPGGESTTMRKLMEAVGLMPALREFAASHPIMGTCAGLILLSKGIDSKSDEPTLGLIDCDVARNAYGRQYFSFREMGTLNLDNGTEPFEMVFIRAPRITRVGDRVDILGRLGGEPTIIRQGNILAMTFHPELSGDNRIHAYFLSHLQES
jgi:5'-phosphate synthase pdxT subunit